MGTFIEDITGGADDYELWLRLASCAPIVFLDRLTLLSRVHSKNYTDTIRITGDVLRILAKTARKCGISENAASASYERIRYKRCKAYIAAGDLSGAAEELNLAAEMGGWKPRYRFVRFLIGIGPAGRRAFTIFKDSAWHFHRIFRAGHVNITKTMSKTEFDRYITSVSGQS